MGRWRVKVVSRGLVLPGVLEFDVSCGCSIIAKKDNPAG